MPRDSAAAFRRVVQQSLLRRAEGCDALFLRQPEDIEGRGESRYAWWVFYLTDKGRQFVPPSAPDAETGAKP